MHNPNLRKMLPRALLLLLVGGVLLVWVAMDWPCAFRSVTGVPCPGCGLSRGWKAAFRLDLVTAFRYHPMFWGIPVFILLFLFDGQLFRQRWLNCAVLAVLLGGFAVCYVVRLICFFT